MSDLIFALGELLLYRDLRPLRKYLKRKKETLHWEIYKGRANTEF